MSVTLHYFDGRGICEPIRMILSYGKIEFEEIRIPYDGFPPTLPLEIKSKCRWGQVPVVEFEGKSLTQSLAVARYFAKRSNLVPEDLYEAALCDEYVDSIQDMMNIFYAALFEKDEEKKQGMVKDAVLKNKSRLNVFESILKSNDGKHLVGNSITWADIYLAYFLPHFSNLLLGVDLVEGFSSLKSLLTNVLSVPEIQDWMEKRPQTKY